MSISKEMMIEHHGIAVDGLSTHREPIVVNGKSGPDDLRNTRMVILRWLADAAVSEQNKQTVEVGEELDAIYSFWIEAKTLGLINKLLMGYHPEGPFFYVISVLPGCLHAVDDWTLDRHANERRLFALQENLSGRQIPIYIRSVSAAAAGDLGDHDILQTLAPAGTVLPAIYRS